MIGKITGLFSGYYGNTALIEVQQLNGCSIGYEITMKTSDIQSFSIGEIVNIFVKEIIKEDDDIFYGFLSFEEKIWFEEFIKLSGLGAKIAISILSSYNCESITEAIMINNCDFFASISGIGSKLANRIPTEMSKQISKIHEKVLTFSGNNSTFQETNNIVKDKNNLYKIDTIEINKKTKPKTTSKSVGKNDNQNEKQKINDAIDALVSLGFAKNKVYDVVFRIVKESDNITTEEIVVEFLKNNN